MIIVLLGGSGTGKTTFRDMILKDFPDLEPIITATTRPIRPGEKNDVDYHFMSEAEFKTRVENGDFVEWVAYHTVEGDWYYGSLMEDYCDYPNDKFIILTPSGYRKAQKAIAADFYSILVESDEAEVRKRLGARGDDPREVDRRIESDKKMFKGFVSNYTLENNGDIEEAYKKLKKVIKQLQG